MLEVLQPILDELIAANEVLMMGHELTASMGDLGRTTAPGNEAQLYLCAGIQQRDGTVAGVWQRYRGSDAPANAVGQLREQSQPHPVAQRAAIAA